MYYLQHDGTICKDHIGDDKITYDFDSEDGHLFKITFNKADMYIKLIKAAN